jgi:hypothetical protein
MKKDRKLIFWSLGGFFFVSIIGSLLHFLYDLSDNAFAVGLFAPVNESVWEHLKLGFTAMLLFSLIDWWWFKYNPNYALGKALGSLAMSGFIVLFVYTYSAVAGDHIFALDIASFLIGIGLMQFIWYRFMVAKTLHPNWFYVGGLLILVQLILFMIFTVYPPRTDLFHDSVTGGYGVEKVL